MNILINCSNLKKGGGLQVADSLCGCLMDYQRHKFIVVLSTQLSLTAEHIKNYANVKIIHHDIQNDWRTILMGRDKVLDDALKEYQINAVLTVFGPARWKPKCKHVCGFARPHLVLKDSPYYKRIGIQQKLKQSLQNWVLKCLFRRSVDVLWTENPYISRKVESLFPQVKVQTVTNYYNQIFDQPEFWKQYTLPVFDGITLLSVNAPYSHKNMEIALDVAKNLKLNHPSFKFRFVMTIPESSYPVILPELRKYFLFLGKVDIDEVPSLYQQADICFQPSLLECFTATFPEAMRMEIPIITTDIEFARGLCDNAAYYYSAVDAQACADAIFNVATNEKLRMRLVAAGKKQLEKYDNYNDRARKLIQIVENL